MSGHGKNTQGKPVTRGSTSTSDQQATAQRNGGAEQAPAWAKALNDETIATVKAEIANIDQKFTDLLKPIIEENTSLRRDVTAMSEDVDRLRQKVLLQQGMIDHLRSSAKSNRDRQIRMESYSMRENIIISGMVESSNETEADLRDKLMELFSTDMSADMTNVLIVKCHRLRKLASNHDGNRNVIVTLSTHLGKMAIMTSARNLKDRPDRIYINDQFPREINSERATLRPIMQLGKKLGKKCALVQEKLLVAGRAYSVDNLNDIPFDISGVATKKSERYVLFSGRITPFSNFYTKKGLFTIDGTDYCSSEQYFQCSKALNSKDFVAAAQIMDTSDPVTMKHVGNNITVPSDWAEKAPAIMETGLRAKFSQNPELAAMLSDTGTRKFQECNRYDSYWGIGLSLTAAAARDDYSQTNGKNVMGNILEAVRDELTLH
jgi:ribA/ribD-fused uncharacterized protein